MVNEIAAEMLLDGSTPEKVAETLDGITVEAAEDIKEQVVDRGTEPKNVSRRAKSKSYKKHQSPTFGSKQLDKWAKAAKKEGLPLKKFMIKVLDEHSDKVLSSDSDVADAA
jgi:hypothetical protein